MDSGYVVVPNSASAGWLAQWTKLVGRTGLGAVSGHAGKGMSAYVPQLGPAAVESLQHWDKVT